MDKKQLGAAPEHEPVSPKQSGWFTRLRAQPGFRTAAVAFFLTVALGAGGPAAYAWWSASTSGLITGTTAAPVLPTPSSPACRAGTPNRVEWAKMTGADPEAVYILTFELASMKGTPVSYAVSTGAPVNNNNRHSVEPTNLADLFRTFGDSGSIIKPVELTVTLRSGIVSVPVGKNPVLIKESDIYRASAPSGSPRMGYYSAGVWGNYPCS